MCRSVEIYSFCLVLQSYGSYSLARNVHKKNPWYLNPVVPCFTSLWLPRTEVVHVFFSRWAACVWTGIQTDTGWPSAVVPLVFVHRYLFNKSVVEPATTLMRWKQSILVTLWIYMDLYGFIFNFEYIDIDVMSPRQVEIMGIQPEVLHGCQVADHLTGKWRLTLSRPWFVGLFHIFFQHKVSTAYHYLSLLFCDSISTFVAHFFKSRR